MLGATKKCKREKLLIRWHLKAVHLMAGVLLMNRFQNIDLKNLSHQFQPEKAGAKKLVGSTFLCIKNLSSKIIGS